MSDLTTPPLDPPPMISADPLALLTPAQAATLLGVSGTTFKRIVGEGGIPFRTIGRRRKYRRDEVLAYVEGTRRFESPPSTNLAPPAPRDRPGPAVTPRSSLASLPPREGRRSLNPFADKMRQIAKEDR